MGVDYSSLKGKYVHKCSEDLPLSIEEDLLSTKGFPGQLEAACRSICVPLATHLILVS